MVRANGKMTQKYAKLIRWPKITFRGPILVPEVSFWGFWGLVCIEKWSQNFDLGTRSAIFGSPKMAKTGVFSHFRGTIYCEKLYFPFSIVVLSDNFSEVNLYSPVFIQE